MATRTTMAVSSSLTRRATTTTVLRRAIPAGSIVRRHASTTTTAMTTTTMMSTPSASSAASSSASGSTMTTTSTASGRTTVSSLRGSSSNSNISSSKSKSSCVGPTLEVSSPHPASNIRLIRFMDVQALHDSPADRSVRVRRERLQRMHHEFWKEYNAVYQSARERFEDEVMERCGRAPTAEEFAQFYNGHMVTAGASLGEYRRRWLRETFALVVPGLRAEARAAVRGLLLRLGFDVDVAAVEAAVAREIVDLVRGNWFNSPTYRAIGVTVR